MLYRKFIAMFLSCVTVLTTVIVFPVFADSKDETDNFKKILEQANLFAHMVVYNECSVEFPGQEHLYKSMEEKGIIVRKDGMWQPASHMQDPAAWEVLAAEYFQKVVFDSTVHLKETENGLEFGATGCTIYGFPSPIYDGVLVQTKQKDFVVLSFPAYVDGIVEPGHTVEFTKTNEKWIISGGSYFESVYASKTNYLRPTEYSDFESLVVLFNYADIYSHMFRSIWHYYVDYHEKNKIPSKGDAWLYEEQYLSQSMTTHAIPPYSKLLNYHDRMDSIAKWEEETLKYFTSNWRGVLPTNSVGTSLLEHEGQTYGFGDQLIEFQPWYQSIKLISLSEKTAEIQVDVIYDGFYDDTLTVEFVNTQNGWRISGGTYFKTVYDAYVVPPKTGENTALYALIFTLAVLPLAVLGVFLNKYRKIGGTS